MNEYLNLLENLIRCKAVSENIENVNRAIGTMRSFLESKGVFCKTEVLDGREILYASAMPGKEQDILLNSHLDVVPAPDSMFEPEIKDGKIFARGSSDCQGNAVILARILCELNGKASVSAVFTSDEEIGGSTTLAMVERGYSARKMVLILDAGPYSIANGQKGIIKVTLRAKGKGGHSAEPWALKNPIDLLIDGYVKLRSLWPEIPADHWGNTMAPCIIRGGSVANQVPDTAEMVLNIRYISEDDFEKIAAVVRSVGLEADIAQKCCPVFVDENHPMMQKLKMEMDTFFGRETVFYRMDGATDARHFAVLKVPVAILGTLGGGMHSSGEWQDLRNAEDYAALLKAFVEENAAH